MKEKKFRTIKPEGLFVRFNPRDITYILERDEIDEMGITHSHEIGRFDDLFELEDNIGEMIGAKVVGIKRKTITSPIFEPRDAIIEIEILNPDRGSKQQ